MQTETIFKKRLTALSNFCSKSKPKDVNDIKIMSQYLQISFACRSEQKRRQESIDSTIQDYNKKLALLTCARDFPKNYHLIKGDSRKACEHEAISKFAIKAADGLIDEKERLPLLTFDKSTFDHDMRSPIDKQEIIKQFESLTKDDHLMVAAILKVWQCMLDGNSQKAREISMKRDPVSVLVAILSPDKLTNTLLHFSRAQIVSILYSMNNLLRGKSSESIGYIFKSKQMLMNDIRKIINTCHDLIGNLTAKDVRDAVKTIKPSANMKLLLIELVRDDVVHFLPWKKFRSSSRTQTGGGLVKEFFTELGLLCLTVLCIIPIVPVIALFVPYLLVPERERILETDPFQKYIDDTFNHLSSSSKNGFVKKMLTIAWGWLTFQVQLVSTISPNRALKRGIAQGAIRAVDKATTVAIPALTNALETRILPSLMTNAAETLMPAVEKAARGLIDLNKMTAQQKASLAKSWKYAMESAGKELGMRGTKAIEELSEAIKTDLPIAVRNAVDLRKMSPRMKAEWTEAYEARLKTGRNSVIGLIDHRQYTDEQKAAMITVARKAKEIYHEELDSTLKKTGNTLTASLAKATPSFLQTDAGKEAAKDIKHALSTIATG